MDAAEASQSTPPADPTTEPDAPQESTPAALPALAPESYFDSLMAVAEGHFRERRRALGAVRTVEDWAERRTRLDGAVREMMGEFPKRTPLCAQVVGRAARAGYSLERVVFQSQPRFYVTANLYVPESLDGAAPGVLIPCGHTAEGKAGEAYQRAAIHLALKGFVALVYDPVGQGERVQYWNEERTQPLLGAGTAEHFADGNLCYLLGLNLGLFRVWDGMRALDYLCSRPEVDETQLGCMGSSGGGTLTTYLAALDNRIKAAAPCCYVTTLRSRFRSRRIADPEQNLLPIVAAGMEIADLLALFAPRPLLIGAAKQDFFPLEGTRRAYRELRSLYRLLGVEERAAMVEVDEPHGWSLGLRQAACAWMIRWLGATEHSLREPNADVQEERATWCFPEGKLYLHVRAMSVSDVLTAKLREVQGGRAGHSAPALSLHDCEALRERVRRAVRCDLSAPPPAVRRGPLEERPWGAVQELQLESANGDVVPATLHLPANPVGSLPAVVAAHSEGRALLSGDDRIGARLAELGVLALCLDPRGVGETRSQLDADSALPWRNSEAEQAYVALMSGVVPLGRRVRDLWTGIGALRHWEGVNPEQIGCLGWGRAATWVGHLAALSEDVRFAAQTRGLSSYESLFSRIDYVASVADFVPRALLDYDLPQLLSLVTPRPLLLLNSVGPDGEILRPDERDNAYEQGCGTYEGWNVRDRLAVDTVETGHEDTAVVEWVRTVLFSPDQTG